MKILSLEESRQITIKFLKYFGVYDKEKVERYFKSSPPPKLESHSGCYGCLWGVGQFVRFMYKFLTRSMPLIEKDIYSDMDFNAYYETRLYGYEETFLDEDDNKRFNMFCKALAKTLKENNINLLYTIETDPKRSSYIYKFKDTLEAKKCAMLTSRDIEEGTEISAHKFIFSEDYLFLLESDSDGTISIYSSQKLINDLKKNYPDYRKDFSI